MACRGRKRQGWVSKEQIRTRMSGWGSMGLRDLARGNLIALILTQQSV